MGKTLWKSQNVSFNGFFRGKHHPAPAVEVMDRATSQKVMKTLVPLEFFLDLLL